MIVRCGRCQIELEVAGAGEFLCPSCGTRNAVRGTGGAPAMDPYGLPDLSNLSPATPAPPPAPAAAGEEPPVLWGTCPSCSFRFARGEVEEVTCPSCSTRLQVSPDGLILASTSSVDS